jgi:hypothetical protein
MSRDEAEAIARGLRELCILREGQALHIGGHVIGPLKKQQKPKPPKEAPRG